MIVRVDALYISEVDRRANSLLGANRPVNFGFPRAYQLRILLPPLSILTVRTAVYEAKDLTAAAIAAI